MSWWGGKRCAGGCYIDLWVREMWTVRARSLSGGVEWVFVLVCVCAEQSGAWGLCGDGGGGGGDGDERPIGGRVGWKMGEEGGWE
jgi:hypothetical protein